MPTISAMPHQAFEDQPPFPTGHYTLGRHHAWLWNDAMQGPEEQAVHPSTACMIALSGSGVSVAEVMKHLETEAQHVLFGELGFVFHKPLRHGQQLMIDTRIQSIDRKHGNRIPVFDRVTLQYLISEKELGEPVMEVRQVWIVDRSMSPKNHEETLT